MRLEGPISVPEQYAHVIARAGYYVQMAITVKVTDSHRSRGSCRRIVNMRLKRAVAISQQYTHEVGVDRDQVWLAVAIEVAACRRPGIISCRVLWGPRIQKKLRLRGPC